MYAEVVHRKNLSTQEDKQRDVFVYVGRCTYKVSRCVCVHTFEV